MNCEPHIDWKWASTSRLTVCTAYSIYVPKRKNDEVFDDEIIRIRNLLFVTIKYIFMTNNDLWDYTIIYNS